MLPQVTFASKDDLSNMVAMLDRLAADLKALRLGAGLTQAVLAERLSVVTSTVTHIELGDRQPGLDVLRSWLAACGATIEIIPPDGRAAPDPLAQLRPALDALPAARRDLVIQAASALAALPEAELQLEATMLQMRAARVVREPAPPAYEVGKVKRG